MESSAAAKKYELAKTSLQFQTKEYFENSTLHGVRYIAEKERPFFDRFLWWCCTSIGATVTLIIIVSLWEKFQTNPTITGLDTDFHNWDVPFPGISICQDNPISEERLSDFIANHYAKIQDQEKLQEYLTAIGQLNYKNIENVAEFYGKYPEFPQATLKEIAMQVVTPCEQVFQNCSAKTQKFDCCKKFFPIFTENGLCYAFNIDHKQGVFSQSGDDIREFQKLYIYETDGKWDLTVHVTNVTENAASIYIHTSEQQPGIDQDRQLLMMDRRVAKMLFSAKTTYTTEDASQLSIKQRHCVFPTEIKLITDDIYTFGACMRECRMKKAFQLCNCVPFFYKDTKQYTYCDLKGFDCINKHKDEIFTKSLCVCELGCDNTVYEIEKLGEGDNSVDEEQSEQEVLRLLEIAFVSWPMIRYKREVLFGWVDLLVSFGGIAGLFLGFSLLSGVEIIYYFSMRACCMYVREKDTLEKLNRENQLEEKPPLDLSFTPYFMRDKAELQKRTLAAIQFVKPSKIP